MKFNYWVQNQDVLIRQADTLDLVEVNNVTFNSNEVKPGWAFIAINGTRDNGAKYIPQALSNGAVAILCDHNVDIPKNIPFAKLSDGRRTAANLARKLYAKPDLDIAAIAVTGTNGKTTTTMIIHQLLNKSGFGCGLIGGVINVYGNNQQKSNLTTPDSCTFYRLLRLAVNSGDSVLAAEVSSHSLALSRVHKVHFRAGVFTNLTQDHLDFHGNIESYFQTKASLFKQCDIGLINVDDVFGKRLLKNSYLTSYAIENHAAYKATDLELFSNKTLFNLKTPNGVWHVRSPLVGKFNVYNLLAALATLSEMGFDLNNLISHIPDLISAPGRVDVINCGQPFGVIVDYAHTPDALEKLLIEGRRLLNNSKGRLHILFGCGGDRDRTKRPIMAKIAARYADVIWHTSDNSRWEDPEDIMADSVIGIPIAIRNNNKCYHQIIDRIEAIKLAIKNCNPHDVLILAGKGHEEYQEIMGVKHSHSDKTIAENILLDLIKEK